MAVEFLALALVGKEAKWLKKIPYEIPMWPKPVVPTSIYCDSIVTLKKD